MKILRLVLKNEPIGIIKLAELSSMPQHKVRYSLRVLEHHGVIRPSPQGAVSTNKATGFLKSFPKESKSIMKDIDKIAKGG
ncbi:MAG: hypothetical protein V3W19_17795 [Desulfatiglandales bacterium]